MDYKDFVSKDVQDLYDVYNHRNGAQILKVGCPDEYNDIMDALKDFRFTLDDIRKPGGNESAIPKKVSALLRAKSWKETRIKGDLEITKISGATTKKKKIED